MRSIKKGGSKASDLVMSTNPVLCNQESPVMPGEPIQANMEDLTLYRTTGGGRKQTGGGPGCCGHLPQSGGKKRRSLRKKKSLRKKSLKNRKSLRKRSKRGGGGNHNHLLKQRGAGSCGNNLLKQRGGEKCNSHNLKQRGGKKKSLRGGKKHPGVKNNCEGQTAGGSDWMSTVYSRGSYIAPDMPESQFRAFTKSAEYVPNSSMRTASFMK